MQLPRCSARNVACRYRMNETPTLMHCDVLGNAGRLATLPHRRKALCLESNLERHVYMYTHPYA